MPRKMQRMCSWCGKHPARIAGFRKYPTWCSKKCQDAELDNNISMEYGIDMDEVRETFAKLAKTKNRR